MIRERSTCVRMIQPHTRPVRPCTEVRVCVPRTEKTSSSFRSVNVYKNDGFISVLRHKGNRHLKDISQAASSRCQPVKLEINNGDKNILLNN